MQRRKLILGGAACGAVLLAGCAETDSGTPSAPDRPAILAANTPEERYKLAEQGAGLFVGQAMAANTVYVYFDTQCPHCATLWANSQPLLAKIRMKWMPVGLLNGASTSQGALILGSEDPLATMREHEELLAKNRSGISVPLSGVDAKFRDQVKRNTEIFKALGATSIPYLVFRNARTGEVGVQAGSMPTDYLASLLGI